MFGFSLQPTQEEPEQQPESTEAATGVSARALYDYQASTLHVL